MARSESDEESFLRELSGLRLHVQCDVALCILPGTASHSWLRERSFYGRLAAVVSSAMSFLELSGLQLQCRSSHGWLRARSFYGHSYQLLEYIVSSTVSFRDLSGSRSQFGSTANRGWLRARSFYSYA